MRRRGIPRQGRICWTMRAARRALSRPVIGQLSAEGVPADGSHEPPQVPLLRRRHVTPVMSLALDEEQRAAKQVQPSPVWNDLSALQFLKQGLDNAAERSRIGCQPVISVIGKGEVKQVLQWRIGTRAYDGAGHESKFKHINAASAGGRPR
jgi:hypothetical protein